MAERASEVVDVAFQLTGTTLPDDYSGALMREVARCLPWFDAEPDAGIHPIRGATTDYGVVLLPRRVKLVLRLSERRVVDAMALDGQTLEIAGRFLRVGSGSVRRLSPYGALYAHCVAAECNSEPLFLEQVASRLAALETPCESVCGRRKTLRAAGREIVGFSLMLHGLALEHSIVLQRVGIGNSRKLGCGIFVPHRLAAAVGSP